MKWIQMIISRMKKLNKQQTPVIYSVDACFTLKNRWSYRQFTDRKMAEQWMQRVIRRFENHKDFPLKMILLCIYIEENEPREVLDQEFFNIEN